MDWRTSRRVRCALFLISALITSPAHAAIGRTPGVATVTADGEAAYSIPLALPPGTNGMTPTLGFEYRHRTETGLLGIGWSISGLSQIARCPRTLVQDGVLSRVTRTSADPFCLDGQRLVVTNGVAYGSAGAEYRTEIESFARIRSLTGASAGPQSFIVESPDGRTYEYGATADSRIDGSAAAQPPNTALIWALNRIRDRSGNVIDFTYSEGPGLAFRIAAIRYNSNPSAGVAPSHEIAFVYENRPNNEVDISYVAGTPVREVLRLDRVEVRYQGSAIRKYELTYEPALTEIGRSRLSSIQECAALGTDCLSATAFTWQNGAPGFQPLMALAAPIATTPWPDSAWYVLDLNGDGRRDFVWPGGSTMAASTIRFRLALPEGGYGPETNSGIPSPNGIGMPFDHNGDARDDLLMISAARTWTVAIGSESGFGVPIATGIAVPNSAVGAHGADINGDGLGDLIWSDSPLNVGGSLHVYARLAVQGGGFTATPIHLYDQAMATSYEQAEGGDFLATGQRIDFDGDGAEDLVINQNYSLARISSTEHAVDQFDGAMNNPVLLDFNGDDCSDLAYRHYTGRLRVRIGGCVVPWAGAELLGPPVPAMYPFDWNNDGREDFLLRGSTTWQVALSNGDSVRPIQETGIPHDGTINPRTVDINGDGLRDLAWLAGGQFRYRLRSGPRPDLLLTATDGFGVRAAFTYAPLSDSSVYTRGSGAVYPVQDRQSSVTVVSRLETTDGSGTGSSQATQFAYEGLRHHVLGRGSLGFAKRTSTDTTPGERHRIEESFRQDFPFTGLPAATVARQESGTAIQATNYSWTSLDLGAGPSLRRFPRISSEVQRSYHVGGALDGSEAASTVRTVASVDAGSGLVTDETSTTTEVSGGVHAGAVATVRRQRTGVLNDATNWCIGRPQSLRVTASHSLPGGAAITRNASQAWDSIKCRPIQQRIESGHPQLQVIYSLAYDTFGNLSSRAVTGTGMNARTVTVNWGGRGQLPSTITNPLSQSVTFGWNLATGQPLDLTDPNALRTRWTYDAFGNALSEEQPDGTRTTWTQTACASGCDPRTRYRIVQQDRDTTGNARVATVTDFDQHERPFRLAMQQPGGGMSVSAVDVDARGRTLREFLPHWDGMTPAGYWQYAYDTAGRISEAALMSAGGAANRTLRASYDGYAVTQTDALGRTNTGVRNAWGRLVQVIDAAGNRTQYARDAFGNPLEVRDSLNSVVESVGYNAWGMKVSQSSRDMGQWTWTRNALGEATAMRDAKQQTFAYTYDSLGRPTSRNAPDGLTTLNWGGSAANRDIGRLAGRSSPGYSETFTYDSAGRPAARTIVTDATYRYDYSYDSLGLLDSITYPATSSGQRFSIRHAYDAGRLVRIYDAADPYASLWRLNARDATGNSLDETLGAGIRVITGFNPMSNAIEYRQASAGANQIQDHSYAWNLDGNLLSRRDALRNLTEEFRYDTLGRLDDSRRNGTINLNVDYDVTGNIRWKSDVCPTGAPCYAYDAARPHAVTSAAGQSYAYDANGNMTSRAGAAITWTSANLPSSIGHANGSSSQFWYGAAGNRWKQVANHAGSTETTIYAGELSEKITRGGVITWRQYVTSPDGVVAIRLQSGSSAPVLRYLTTDHLGSTDRIVDPAGVTLVSESFAPFGKRRGPTWNGPPSAADLAAISSITRDGFTGHEHLDNLDLIHMNGRVYDPHLGRFISADPYITAPFDGQGLNRYSYVLNNPLAFVDPSGFTPQAPCMTERQGGPCVQITLIGARWRPTFYTFNRYRQTANAEQRDPCGMESSALACATQNGRFTSPSQIVLTAGTQVDPSLGRSPTVDYLAGAAARLGNIGMNAAPVTWLFGVDSDFEWFDVPDSAAGQAGADTADVGEYVTGFAGIIRKGGRELANRGPSAFARSLQGTRDYPGIDRFRDIILKKGTRIVGGVPGQSNFYSTLSALGRSGFSARDLFRRLQVRLSRSRGTFRDRVAIYEVLEDTEAAFGFARANTRYGPGGLPQIVIEDFESKLLPIMELRLGP